MGDEAKEEAAKKLEEMKGTWDRRWDLLSQEELQNEMFNCPSEIQSK